MNNPADYQLKVFHGKAGLDEIASDWQHLTDEMVGKGYHHLLAWYECYMDDLEENPEAMCFCVLYNGGKAKAIFPFKRSIRSWLGIRFHVLGWPQKPYLFFSDFIFSKNAESHEFMDILLRKLSELPELRWDIIYLPRVLDDSCIAFTWPSPSGLRIVRRYVRDCHYHEITSYEQIYNRCSSNFRKNLRSARNKLTRLKSATFHTACTELELGQAYIEFLDVEGSGWKQEQGSAIKQNERLISFYRNLIHHYSKFDGCEIHLLRHENKSIAAGFTLLVDGTCYFLKTGYDEEYAKMSPGHLLVGYMLQRYEMISSVKVLNSISNAPWHNKWKPSCKAVFKYYVFNTTWKGLLAHLVHLLVVTYKVRIMPIVKRVR